MATTDQIDRVLSDAAVAQSVPGAVALAADDAGVFHRAAFGRRSLVEPAPMTLDTIFRIMSMTKAVTAVAAMQLVERGKLRLDQPLGDLVPEIGAARVLTGFDDGNAPQLRPPATPVTLRHLLTHTAGYAYDSWNADVLRYQRVTKTPTITAGRSAALGAPLVFDPGTRWQYGINSDLLGKVIEAVDGRSLDRYFEDEIFAPLGMTETGFALKSGQESRLATVHQRQPDGTLKPIRFDLPPTPEFLSGGHGLYSTGDDFIALLQMLLAGGSRGSARLLRSETVAEMARNQIGELNVERLRTTLPSLSNDVIPPLGAKWGLGFLVGTRDAPTGRAAGSYGWAGILNSYFWIDPRKRVTGLIMMQILPFFDEAALALYGRYERAIYAAHDR